MFTEGRADIKAERGSLSLSGFLRCAVVFSFYQLQREDELSTLCLVSINCVCVCVCLVHFLFPMCIYFYVCGSVDVFVPDVSMHTFLSVCVCVCCRHISSGCDTVATNYRSGRLKPGEEGANQSLGWSGSSTPRGQLKPLSASLSIPLLSIKTSNSE